MILLCSRSYPQCCNLALIDISPKYDDRHNILKLNLKKNASLSCQYLHYSFTQYLKGNMKIN